MHNYRKFIASAVALLGLLTANGALDSGPDDMHWIIGPSSTITNSAGIPAVSDL
jgi:hypothetical protein